MSVAVNSTTSEGRLGFPAPPDHQCPSIDYVIKAIRTCEKYMRRYDRMEEDELKDVMWNVEREMFDLEKKMEEIRSACEGLCEWGLAWKNLCKNAADKRDLDLEDL